MTTHSDVIQSRAMIAREEFLKCYRPWWPAVYTSLFPVTDDGKELIKCANLIDEMIAKDVAAYQAEQRSPWVKRGALPSVVDWGRCKAPEVVYFLERRAVGMPAPVKLGNDPDGRSYFQHPAVLEAQARAPQTAEWLAKEEMDEAQQAYNDAGGAYADAYNAYLDAHPQQRKWEEGYKPTAKEQQQAADDQSAAADKDPAVAKLKRAMVPLEKQLDKATKEFKRLREDPEAATEIVRDAPTSMKIVE